MDIPQRSTYRQQDADSEDFEGVIVGLIFDNTDIKPVNDDTKNAHGIYENPRQTERFRYSVAFAYRDDQNTIWIETFSAKRLGDKFVLGGRYSSYCVCTKTANEDDLVLEASRMVNNQLS